MLKVMKIPTQKGEHSCKCTELSLKRKSGITLAQILLFIKETIICITNDKRIQIKNTNY